MPELFSPANSSSVSARELMAAVHDNKIIHLPGPVTVSGELNLIGLDVKAPFVIRQATFQGLVDLSSSRFHRTVDLSGGTFQQSLTLAGARFDQDLLVNDANLGGPMNCELIKVRGKCAARGLQSVGPVVFTSAKVEGEFSAAATPQRETVIKGDLKMQNAQVGGNLVLEGAEVQGDVDLDVAQIEGSLSCGLLRDGPRNSDKPLRQTRIGQSLMLGGARVQGQVDLIGAKVDGQVLLYSATVRCGLLGDSEGEWQATFNDFQASAAEFGANVSLYRAHVLRDLSMNNAEVSGTLSLNGTRIGQEPPADPDKPGGNVYLGHVHVSGGIEMLGARVLGMVDLSSAHVRGGVWAYTKKDVPTEIGGNVFLTAASLAGNVDFSHTRIKGRLKGNGAAIQGNLFANGATIGPDAADGLDHDAAFLFGLNATGQVSFIGAKLEGDLNLHSANIQGGLIMWSSEERQTTVTGAVLLGSARVAMVVNLEGAHVGGHLNLGKTSIQGDLNGNLYRLPGEKLIQHRTTVEGEARLEGCQITGSVNLRGSRLLTGLLISGAQITGGLDCSGIEVKGGVVLDGSVFGGRIVATQLIFGAGKDEADRFEPSVAGLWSMKNTEVGNEVNLRGCRLDDGITLDAAVIRGSLTLAEAVIKARRAPWYAVSTLGTRVASDVNLGAAQITGVLKLAGIQVERDLVCSNLQVLKSEPADNTSGEAQLQTAQVNGKIDLSQTRLASRLVLIGTQVKRELNLDRTEILGDALFQEMTIGGRTEMKNVRVVGDLKMTGANLAGRLKCLQVRCEATSQPRWEGDELTMTGSMILRNLRTTNEVVLEGITLDGELTLDGAELRGDLSLRATKEARTTVQGPVLLTDARVSGDVRLSGAKVVGDLNLAGATVQGRLIGKVEAGHRLEVHEALKLDNAHVAGEVALQGALLYKTLRLQGVVLGHGIKCGPAAGADGQPIPTEIAAVIFNDARVSGAVDFGQTIVKGNLSLRGTVIQGALHCQARLGETPTFQASNGLDLQGCQTWEATLGFLPPADDAAKDNAPKINLEGFQFQHLKVPNDDYRDFLNSQVYFAKSNYARVERFLRDQGRDDEADGVHLDMLAEHRAAMLARKESQTWRWPLKWGWAIMDWALSIGYWVPASLLLALLLLFLIPTWWMYSDARAVRPEVLSAAGGTWTGWDGGALAFQTLVPLVEFCAPEKWRSKALSSQPIALTENRVLPFSYAAWGSWMSLLGYLMLPVMLARIVVVLKRQR